MHLISPRFLQGALCACFLFFAQNLAAQKLKIYDLSINQLSTPLSVDPRQVAFSWKISSDKKATRQTRYEIRVLQAADAKPVWQTAVSSEQSIHIPYSGPALGYKSRYTWQVRVQDNHDRRSAWSDLQEFGTLLRAEDWTAQWITVPGQDTSAASPFMRREFEIKKPVRSATVYMTARGLYEARINGERLSDHYFAPGWTSYKNHIQYQVYPLTEKLKKGKNVLGVLLGNGWYKGRIGFSHQSKFYGDTRAMRLQLEVEYTDGSREVVLSDGSWKTASGPILASDIYDGETYDARRELPGWDRPDFTGAEKWQAVRVLPAGTEKLVAMTGPPVRKKETFKPVKIFKTPAGDQVIDFGQNLVGWVMMRANGPAGARVILSHAEVLDKAGNFYTTNLRSAKQQNQYILKAGPATFEPHFSFQGFRYVKVEGYPGALKPEDFTAVALYSDMQPAGKFTTSNTLINQLQHNIQWGQKGNFVDVPTDCPQRDERLGWTGDAQAFAATAAYNMDVAGFFTKWLRDLAADQHGNGSVPFVIPNVLNQGDAGATGWADAATIIPWTMYQTYGDQQILKTQYESMKRWVDYMTAQSVDHLWAKGFHFGDWLFYRPNDDNDGRAAVTDKYMIAQCFYANSVLIMAKTAAVLNKAEDEARYLDLLPKIKSAFVAEYMTPKGKLVSNTQTAYVLALQFDMLPEQLRAQAAKRLVENVQSYGNHLTTGFLGTPYLCHVLSRFGYDRTAYDLLLQESYPSWLYPVKMGATTIWERWDGIKPDGSFQTADMNSFNHYAYGAIGDWMYKNIAGINPVEDAPAYKVFNISPKPGGKLTNAAAALETVYGPIKSSWTLADGKFTLDVSVPVNTTANIRLPGSEKIERVGSGDYRFQTAYAMPK